MIVERWTIQISILTIFVGGFLFPFPSFIQHSVGFPCFPIYLLFFFSFSIATFKFCLSEICADAFYYFSFNLNVPHESCQFTDMNIEHAKAENEKAFGFWSSHQNTNKTHPDTRIKIQTGSTMEPVIRFGGQCALCIFTWKIDWIQSNLIPKSPTIIELLFYIWSIGIFSDQSYIARYLI